MKERVAAMKSVKQQNQLQQQVNHDSEVSPFAVAKLLNPDADWDKDQLGDVLHWIRQIVGLFCGVLWGIIPLTGSLWFLLFMGLSTSIVYAYYTYILKIDEEEFGGHGTLLQEGMFASVTLFLLAWIVVYSLVHF